MIQFKHPQPNKAFGPIWPVFVPFAGCPHRCSFCSQLAQTGQTPIPLHRLAQSFFQSITERYNRTKAPIGLGFYGGTFTAIRQKDLLMMLKTASALKQAGAVNHIRCSTRPDYVSKSILRKLQAHQVDLIELGVQSFDNNVLKKAGRGYSGRTAIKACQLIKESGFDLGIQLMPGLPGCSGAIFLKDIRKTIQAEPALARIYPCLVLDNTELKNMFCLGLFSPWSLAQTVHLVSLGLLSLWLAGISVIRIGLTPEKSLLDSIWAGPWDPGLGSKCRSLALRSYFTARIAALGRPVKRVMLPEKCISDFWGHKRINERHFQRYSIIRKNVQIWNRDYFRVY
ncbi:radical SAM protein [Desulfonatronovibrio magnus]|uniref:radical SAM protein n=1 Tax=Desulfonatronovibrio magnus TaxID=698827 RepID=UPI000696FEC2|nr:radical SAM protein [Desulfonatronovibrio magnus]